MKNLLIGLLVFVSIHAMGQNDRYDILKDKKTGATVIKGECTFDDLLRQPSLGWLTRGANNYKPDTAKLSYLKRHIKDYEIVVFMGTWCDDTYNILPKLYKILLLTNYPMSEYTMYGVDRTKATKYIEHKLYKIENVPTIILSRQHTEIGRITESLKKTVESDIAGLIDADITKQEMQQQQMQNK